MKYLQRILPVLVFVAGRLSAEEISADQIVGQVLEHSYHLKMAADQVTAAEAVKQQAATAAWPFLDLDARGAHYEGLQENNFPNLRIPAIPDRYNGGMTLSQPLYTGGKIAGRKQMTAEQKLSAQAALRAARVEVIYQARTAYWSWSKAFHAAESFQAAVAWMEAHDRDMGNMYAAGLATENDRLATAVRLDQTRLQLEEALRRADLWRAAIEQLAGQALPSAATPARPAGAEAALPTGAPQFIQHALTNRPDARAQQFALNAARQNFQIQAADYFPQLSANLRGEVGRPNPLNVPPQDQWQFDAFLGLSATWNILDWGLTRGKVNEARAQASREAHRLAQLNERIVFEVRQALINLDNARTRWRVAKRATASARLDIKSATDLWQNGLARHSDVLDSQARLTAADFELVAAGADIALARAELEHACGLAEIKGPAAAP